MLGRHGRHCVTSPKEGEGKTQRRGFSFFLSKKGWRLIKERPLDPVFGRSVHTSLQARLWPSMISLQVPSAKILLEVDYSPSLSLSIPLLVSSSHHLSSCFLIYVPPTISPLLFSSLCLPPSGLFSSLWLHTLLAWGSSMIICLSFLLYLYSYFSLSCLCVSVLVSMVTCGWPSVLLCHISLSPSLISSFSL